MLSSFRHAGHRWENFKEACRISAAPQLGAIAVREAVKRANLDPKQVDECIMGNVVSAGLGQNPARQAAIFGGLAPETGAMTINKVCGSGLKAVALGSAGDSDGEQFDRGRGRHGVDDQRALPAAAGAQGLPPGQFRRSSTPWSTTASGTSTTTTTWESRARTLRRSTASRARSRTSLR